MKLDTLGVQAFVALAEWGSFVRAASQLYITQTALSRRLQNLEAVLGVRLMERTTRSCALTPVGEDFLPLARRLLGELESALTEIRERGRAARGQVTLACVPTMGIRFLPRLLRVYAQRWPGNRVNVLDHAAVRVEQAVLRREAEFGIGVSGALHDELVLSPLLQDRFVLLCRRDHPLTHRRSIGWAQLDGHALILPGPGSSNRPLLDAGLAQAGIEVPRPRYEVQRSSTALGLVAAGVGVAVVPSLALQPESYPQLHQLTLTEPRLTRRFVLLLRRGGGLSPAAQALYDLCAKAALDGPLTRA